MPLVKGRYHATNPVWSAIGQPVNATQSDIAQRSNIDYTGVVAITDAAAALVTQVCTAVAIPVEYGDVITKVGVLVGATAANTPTNSWAALYSGITVPALMAQATDITTTAIAASALFTWTLATPQLVTPANAPNGFLYASIMVKATGVPSLASVSLAAAVDYKWFTNGPLGFTLAHGAALTTTAPATITGQAAQATTPLVFLS